MKNPLVFPAHSSVAYFADETGRQSWTIY